MALYRGKKISGALPRTRSLGKGNVLAFRIDEMSARLKSKLQQDQRISFIDKKNTRWFTFELSSDSDLRGALDWLGNAYDLAPKRQQSKN